ncbi:MAG: hypothetical protein WCG47_17855 [Dermatophilaceae bacterium]
MAYAILCEVPGISQADYEQVTRAVNAAGGSPAGCVFHAGGPIEGGVRAVEVWDSREAAEAFYGSDVLRQASEGVPGEVKVLMTWPVVGVDDGSGWRSVS